MAHINKLIDFVAVAYIVNDDRVLLADHKKIGTWLPVGGHIELEENPEQALLREIQEECGLSVKIAGDRPDVSTADVESLIAPCYLNIHWINEQHRHVAFIYFGVSKTDQFVLKEDEHNAMHWFTFKELAGKEFAIRSDVRFYAEKAITALKNQ